MQDIERETIGFKIKTLRESEGMTQVQLAEALNCSVTIISYWECDVKFPNSQNIILLCKLFDVSADYLLGLKEI